MMGEVGIAVRGGRGRDGRGRFELASKDATGCGGLVGEMRG